ncbi:DUF2783 domain-containing protein [Aquisalimonas sp.]|uniref:DUF2783 domain-containing protein n=1 Tax=Aquisalimonas sp. TaxID=1872621 RepID=UPI0025BF8DBB|nr:DUF2783 domain-containing protein [Aquisalimonas sp.]
MSSLELEPNFTDADAFYAALAEVHRDCDDETSRQINARLILILANQVGDQSLLEEALHVAAEIKHQQAQARGPNTP